MTTLCPTCHQRDKEEVMNNPTYKELKEVQEYLDGVSITQQQLKTCYSGKTGQIMRNTYCHDCNKTHWKWVDK